MSSNRTQHVQDLPDLCLLMPVICLIFSVQDGSLSREKSFDCYLPVLSGKTGKTRFNPNSSPIQPIELQGAILINALNVPTRTFSTFFRRFLVIVAWHLSAKRPLQHHPSDSTHRLHHVPLRTSHQDQSMEHSPSSLSTQHLALSTFPVEVR